MNIQIEVPKKGYGLNIKKFINQLRIIRSRGADNIVEIKLVDDKIVFEVK